MLTKTAIRALLATMLLGSGVRAVEMETVPVGNAGNAADPGSGFGDVDYSYNIGKYEVTAGQYCEFLNAVAATDTYDLYALGMRSTSGGCRIERTGSPGSYSYSVAADWADRPVNYVSWGDAARFCNWLHNGQPTGAQDDDSTEDGAYDLDGALTDWQLKPVPRASDARWFIPSEDEWYKAAYHKNDGVTGNYWDYPTGTDAEPDNGNPGGDSGNSANFREGDDDYTVGDPYYTTPVGYFNLSDSPYGTFDQGGNVWEWTEEIFAGSGCPAACGGDWRNYRNHLYARIGAIFIPSREFDTVGFRVASIPEPGGVLLLICGLGMGLWRRRRNA